MDTEIRDTIPQPNPNKLRTGISIDRNNKTATDIENAMREGGGKIPYSQLMDISLFGPEGYYSTGKAKINGEKKEQDFETYTAHESFNQTVGNSLLKVWESMDQPEKFDIVEQGAGMGIMAKDMLVWARENHPTFYNALNYIIVEPGDLIQQQKETIGKDVRPGIKRARQLTPDENAKDLEKVRWIQGSASQLPLKDESIEGVFLSNELPDAFPVEIAKKINGAVKQKYVTLENDEWVEVWDEPTADVQRYIEEYGIDFIDNGGEEAINLNAEKWQKGIDRALKRGAIITIDYGQNGTRNNTKDIRATRTYPPMEGVPRKEADRDPERYDYTTYTLKYGKAQVTPKYSEYRDPGNFDMTSDINFAVHEHIAHEDGLSLSFTGSQQEFLLSNGVGEFLPIKKIRETRSLNELGGLLRQLKEEFLSLKNGKNFYAQVLTKGIDLTFDPHPEYPTVDAMRNTGFKLEIGKPNTPLTIERISYGQESKTYTTGATGTLPFFEAGVDPEEFFFPYSPQLRYVIRAGEEIILDTRDKDTLKNIVERSGYQYDLAA